MQTRTIQLTIDLEEALEVFDDDDTYRSALNGARQLTRDYIGSIGGTIDHFDYIDVTVRVDRGTVETFAVYTVEDAHELAEVG